jgi:hypothetical protein
LNRQLHLSRTASIAVKLFFILLCVYLVTMKTVVASDTFATDYLPWLMIRQHTVSMDYVKPSENDYRFYPHNGHYYSTFPPGTAFIALPIYLIPSLFINTPSDVTMGLLAKVSASLMMALAAVLLFLIAFRLSRNRKTAIITALVFALGTNVFAMTSQMMLNFTGAILFLTLGTYFLVKGNSKPIYLVGAGFAFAYAGFCQLSSLVFLLVFGLYVLLRRRRDLSWYILGALPVGLILMLYNFVAFGSPLRNGEILASSFILKGSWQVPAHMSELWSTPVGRGLAGSLFSPSRGIFVFSPVLLFAFVGLYMVWRLRGNLTVLAYGFIGSCLAILIASLWYDWFGGNGFGYRVTLGTLPFLCLLLVPAVPRILSRKPLIALFALLLAFSVFVQAIGYISYDGISWERRYLELKSQKNIWSLTTNQLVWEIGHASFYVPPAWQTLIKSPAHDTRVTKILTGHGKPGTFRIGAQTDSKRLARFGIYVVKDGKLVTQTLTIIPRGRFMTWTEDINDEVGSVVVQVFVSNLGPLDKYIESFMVYPGGKVTPLD